MTQPWEAAGRSMHYLALLILTSVGFLQTLRYGQLRKVGLPVVIGVNYLVVVVLANLH
jgi:hypothetical protein